MTTTIPSAALVPAAPVFTKAERLALAGFLAAHSGLTRQAYELDLRQYASWCQQHHLRLFQARRADRPLDTDTLRALNARVELAGQDPRLVAAAGCPHAG